MENFQLVQDIKVFTLTAASFPEGIEDAHQKIQAIFKNNSSRRCFGISRPENGNIKYMAAAEQLFQGELGDSGLDKFVINKGEYISILVENFRKDMASIAKAFNLLILHPEIDPEGYCIEWYLGENDVRCIVRLKS